MKDDLSRIPAMEREREVPEGREGIDLEGIERLALISRDPMSTISPQNVGLLLVERVRPDGDDLILHITILTLDHLKLLPAIEGPIESFRRDVLENNCIRIFKVEQTNGFMFHLGRGDLGLVVLCSGWLQNERP